MIKIEYDGSKGMFKLEERAKNETERMANILGLLNCYYTENKKRNPEYAEKFKEALTEDVNDGTVFATAEELDSIIGNKIKDTLSKLFLGKFGKLDEEFADFLKDLKKSNKTSKDKKKTKKD